MTNVNRQGKDSVTVYGQRNWQRLVDLSTRQRDDRTARRVLADALAALVTEVTPMHREVLASQYLLHGAQGRTHTHPLPPGLPPTASESEKRRWAALVVLDCVDHASDVLSKDHSLSERLGWRAAIEAYTQGAERRQRR